MILLIDNYDSFTYNLYQEIGKQTKQTIKVVKNDQVDPADLNQPNLAGLLLSPGPGRPENAGNMNRVLQSAIGKVPILGICLGHQAIGEVYGGRVIEAPRMMHGKVDCITQNHNSDLLRDCPTNFNVGRYHSLVIDPNSLNNGLKVGAVANDGTIQAVYDNYNQVFGLEFHPESIMTDQKVAKVIFKNFLKMVNIHANS